MSCCVAVGCSNRGNKGFLMKVFPRDPARRAIWAANVKRDNWKPNNVSSLCEVHFDDDQWEKTRVDGSRKLKWNAVPTLFSHTGSAVKRKATSTTPIKRKRTECVTLSDYVETVSLPQQKEFEERVPVPSIPTCEVMADEDVSRTDSHYSSSPATPIISNPGTPRSEISLDVRATPPLSRATPPLARSTPPLARATPPLARATPPLAQATPPLARATPPLARATPPLARATPPLARAMPPLARATPPLNQGHSLEPLVNTTKPVTQPSSSSSPLAHAHHHQSKYASLLAVIEDMGRDIRPTYAGNRSCTERFKRSIVHARILVRECLMECERSART